MMFHHHAPHINSSRQTQSTRQHCACMGDGRCSPQLSAEKPKRASHQRRELQYSCSTKIIPHTGRGGREKKLRTYPFSNARFPTHNPAASQRETTHMDNFRQLPPRRDTDRGPQGSPQRPRAAAGRELPTSMNYFDKLIRRRLLLQQPPQQQALKLSQARQARQEPRGGQERRAADDNLESASGQDGRKGGAGISATFRGRRASEMPLSIRGGQTQKDGRQGATANKNKSRG